VDVIGQPVVFKLSKQQLAERKTLAADLCKQAATLNTAIVAFNAAVEPLSQAVGEAQADYNAILEKARMLASSVTAVAQQKFVVRSGKWQDSDKGLQARCWIEQWEIDLDDLDLPEPLMEIDSDEHGGWIEAAPPNPTA
jgi:cell division septum initiation protein DivIVA